MRNFGTKVIINLIIGSIKVLTVFKRGLFSLFLILFKFLIKVGEAFFRLILLPIYKKYIPAEKKFLSIFGKSPKNKFFFILSNPKSINVLLVLIAILITFSNIKAQGKEQDATQQISPLFVLLSDGEEEISEEALLEENTPLENFFSDASAVRPTLQVEESQVETEETTENLIVFYNDSFLFKPCTPITRQTPQARTEIESYTVQAGDTISDIAEEFGLWVNTILWENNLTAYSLIKPGMKLDILPVNGITHKVKKGDTIKAIAQRYKAEEEEIIKFNKLSGEKILDVGLTLVIPDGKQYFAPATNVVKSIPSVIKGIFQGHIFPWGQCTWYVAQKKLIPWSGNANQWLAKARNYGYKIGKNPVKGAIVSLKESGWQARLYGHVAYVEEVRENEIVISEMNYKGKGVYSKRTIPINSKKIIGYIY